MLTVSLKPFYEALAEVLADGNKRLREQLERLEKADDKQNDKKEAACSHSTSQQA